MRKIIVTILLCLFTVSVFAASFNSKDGSFTLPMPSRWQNEETKNTEVLRLKNGDNKIVAVKLEKCKDLACLEQIINKRVKQIKNKKYQLIKNTYSGEEIKKTEFSSLDPLLYFSYTANKIPHTEGYFLADSKGYKIEVSGLPYLEAENYLPFISPKPKEIQDLPLITEEQPLVEENIDIPDLQTEQRQPLSQTLANKQEIKETARQKRIELPKRVLLLMLLVFLYLLIWTGFFSFNMFFAQKQDRTPTNPKSFYPIRGARLYGSPDLFLRFYDSQGQNFIITSPRWASFLLVGGFYGALFFAVMHFIFAAILKQGIHLHPMLANTALSLCYLFMAFGIIFMIGGKVLDIMFPPTIYIYNGKGTVLFKIIRRGSGIFNYAYLVMTEGNEVIYRMETPKLFLIRKWMLFDKIGELAVIKEKSLLKALGRKLLGHLGGSLRASYFVKGKNESSGEVNSLRKISASFHIDIDKPQAIPSTAMLAAAAIIFITGRDKYYPWFN